MPVASGCPSTWLWLGVNATKEESKNKKVSNRKTSKKSGGVRVRGGRDDRRGGRSRKTGSRFLKELRA